VNKRIIFLMLMWLSFDSVASVPIEVHSHKYYSEGVLPEPYKSYTLRVELDEETDDVTVLEFRRGREFVHIPASVIEQLKDVELGTIMLTHEMHRYDENPTSSFHQGESDWFHITFEVGKKYRAEKLENGVSYFKWGKDSLTVTITNKNTVTVDKQQLKTTHDYWSEKTW
jgi:hypothetical protein